MHPKLTWYEVEVGTGHTPNYIMGVEGKVVLAGGIGAGGVMGVARSCHAEHALIQSITSQIYQEITQWIRYDFR